jgi:hypothetical protein
MCSREAVWAELEALSAHADESEFTADGAWRHEQRAPAGPGGGRSLGCGPRRACGALRRLYGHSGRVGEHAFGVPTSRGDGSGFTADKIQAGYPVAIGAAGRVGRP